MAVTITDHRTIANEADATTNWTGSPTLFTADPDPVEATGSIGYVVSTTTVDAFVTISSTSLTGKILYVWVLPRGAMDTKANGGVAIEVGDGTNRVSYHVAGSDVAGFRHDSGPVAWMCIAIDQSNLPTQKTVRAGAEGSLNWGAITQVGAMFKTLAKSTGGVANCWVDVIRYADLTANNGAVMSITGGTSGDPGTFAQIATGDRSIANQQAFGVMRELGSGLYGVQGSLRFGDATGSTSSWFQDSNVSVAFEARGFTTSRYGIYITDNGTGTTTFKLGTKVGSGNSATGSDGVNLIVPTGVGGFFNSGSDTDVTDVFIYGSTLSGFTGGITLGGSQEFIGNTVNGSGAITVTGLATLVNTTINSSTVAADSSSLVWNLNTDPSGYLDGMKFTKGTNAHHAIEFGTSSPTTISLVGQKYTGFNASNGQNDSTLHIKRTTGTVTFNITSGGNTPSYKTDGATVVISSSVNVTVTIKDQSGNPIPGVEVAIFQDNAARTVVLASTPTNGSGQVTTSSAASLGAIIIRARQSSSKATFATTSGVNGSTEVITTNANHNFRDGDAVVYGKNGGTASIGLTAGTTYYVNNISATTLSLHTTAANAIADTSRVDLTASGAETHVLDPVRYVAASATGTIGTADFTAQITMITDTIATG